ncbi:hypothetical protein SS50377_22100 [Spironucleus salmonicida]|nr:hypothetical protein SS50377_22100 [Spironucleus salmonicida]
MQSTFMDVCYFPIPYDYYIYLMLNKYSYQLKNDIQIKFCLEQLFDYRINHTIRILLLTLITDTYNQNFQQCIFRLTQKVVDGLESKYFDKYQREVIPFIDVFPYLFGSETNQTDNILRLIDNKFDVIDRHVLKNSFCVCLAFALQRNQHDLKISNFIQKKIDKIHNWLGNKKHFHTTFILLVEHTVRSRDYICNPNFQKLLNIMKQNPIQAMPYYVRICLFYCFKVDILDSSTCQLPLQENKDILNEQWLNQLPDMFNLLTKGKELIQNISSALYQICQYEYNLYSDQDQRNQDFLKKVYFQIYPLIGLLPSKQQALYLEFISYLRLLFEQNIPFFVSIFSSLSIKPDSRFLFDTILFTLPQNNNKAIYFLEELYILNPQLYAASVFQKQYTDYYAEIFLLKKQGQYIISFDDLDNFILEKAFSWISSKDSLSELSLRFYSKMLIDLRRSQNQSKLLNCVASLLNMVTKNKFYRHNFEFEYTLILLYVTEFTQVTGNIQLMIYQVWQGYIENCINYNGLFTKLEFKEFFQSSLNASICIQKTQDKLLLLFLQQQLLIDIQQQDSIEFNNMILIFSYMRQFVDMHSITEISQKTYDIMYQYYKQIFSSSTSLQGTKVFINKLSPTLDIPKQMCIDIQQGIKFKKEMKIHVEKIGQMQLFYESDIFSTILLDIAKNSNVIQLTDKIFIRLLVFQILRQINIFDLQEQFVSAINGDFQQDYTLFIQKLLGQQNIILLFIGLSLIVQKISSPDFTEIFSILSLPFLIILTYIPDFQNKIKNLYQPVDLSKVDLNQVFQNLLYKKQLIKDSNVCQLIITFICQQRFIDMIMIQKQKLDKSDIISCNCYVLSSIFANNTSIFDYISDLTPGEIKGYMECQQIDNFDPVYVKHRLMKLNYVFTNSFFQQFNLPYIIESFQHNNLLNFQQEQFEQYIYLMINSIQSVQQFVDILKTTSACTFSLVKLNHIKLSQKQIKQEDLQFDIICNSFQKEMDNQYLQLENFIYQDNQQVQDVYSIIFDIILYHMQNQKLEFLTLNDYDIQLDLTQLFYYYEITSPQILKFSYQQVSLLLDYLNKKELIDFYYLEQVMQKSSYAHRAEQLFYTTLNKQQITSYFSLSAFLSFIFLISQKENYSVIAASLLYEIFKGHYFQMWRQYLITATNMNRESSIISWIQSFSSNIPILVPGITYSMNQIIGYSNNNSNNNYYLLPNQERIFINLNDSFFKSFYSLESRGSFQTMPHNYSDNSKTCSDHYDAGAKDDSLINQDANVDSLRNISLSELFLAQLLELLGTTNSIQIFSHYINFVVKDSLNIENTLDKLIEIYCNNRTFLAQYQIQNEQQQLTKSVKRTNVNTQQKKKQVAKSQSFFAKSEEQSDTSQSKRPITINVQYQNELINTYFDYQLIDQIIISLSFVLAEPILLTLLKFTYHRDQKQTKTILQDIIVLKEQKSEYLYGFASRMFMSNVIKQLIDQNKIKIVHDSVIFTTFAVLLTKGSYTEIKGKILIQDEDDTTNTNSSLLSQSSHAISSHKSSNNTSKITTNLTSQKESNSIVQQVSDTDGAQIQISLPQFHFLSLCFGLHITSQSELAESLLSIYGKSILPEIALQFVRQTVYFSIEQQFHVPWVNPDKFVEILGSEYSKAYILYQLPQIFAAQSIISLENRYCLLENIYAIIKLIPSRPTELQLGQLTTEILFIYMNQILINELSSIEIILKSNTMLDQIIFSIALIATSCEHTRTIQNLIILFKLLMLSDHTLNTAYYLYDIFQQFINIERSKPVWLQILQIIQSQNSSTIIKFWNHQLKPLKAYINARQDFMFVTAPQSFQSVFASQMDTVKQWEANLRIRNRETDSSLSQLKPNERPLPSKIYTVYLEECIKSSLEDIRKYLGDKFETSAMIKRISQCGESYKQGFLPIIKLKFKFSQAQLKTMIVVHLVSMMVYRVQHKTSYLSSVLHSLILLFRISVQNKTIQPDDKLHDVQRIINLFTCQEEREELCLDKKYDCKTLLSDLGVVLNKEFFQSLIDLMVFEPYQTAAVLLLVTSVRSLGPQFQQFNYLLANCQKLVTLPHCKQIMKNLCAKLFISGDEQIIQFSRGPAKQLEQFKNDFFGE